MSPVVAVLLSSLALSVTGRWFGGRRRPTHGKELAAYRRQLGERTRRVRELVIAAADDIDALRRLALQPEDAIPRLAALEAELEPAAEELMDLRAPEELHGLHMEYEANLERALRGLITAARGCALTRMPHRPPDDEEPFTYYKRGHLNLLHARLRMDEIVDVLHAWDVLADPHRIRAGARVTIVGGGMDTGGFLSPAQPCRPPRRGRRCAGRSGPVPTRSAAAPRRPSRPGRRR